MIARHLRTLAAVAALLTLTACVSIKAVPAGPYASGGHQVTLGKTWADFSPFSGAPKTVKLLTIDGPLLNRLYIIDGLKSGEFIVKPARKEQPTPTWRPGMTPVEQVEFVTDSVSALGYQRVETDELRPIKMGASDGLRVNIAAKTAGGLDIAGVAQLTEVGDRLYVILYLAPAEHYFGATQGEVEAVMNSARVAG